MSAASTPEGQGEIAFNIAMIIVPAGMSAWEARAGRIAAEAGEEAGAAGKCLANCFVAGTPILVPGPVETAGDDDPATAGWQHDKLLAGACLLVGLSGVCLDEQRTRRKRKQRQGIVDLLFAGENEDEKNADGSGNDWAAEAFSVDQEPEDLYEPDVMPWQTDNHDADTRPCSLQEVEVGSAVAVAEPAAATATTKRPWWHDESGRSQPRTKADARPPLLGRAARRLGRWPLALCLLAGLLLAGGWLSPSPVRHSPVRAGGVAYATRAIEQIRVGQRVVAENPDPASSARTDDRAVDPATWRRLVLRAEDPWPDGTVDVVNVETLQSPEWIKEHQAKVGAMVPLPLDLLEMGMSPDLRAKVVANDRCPAIPTGSGCVVVTTINHLNRYVFELTVQDEQGRLETIRPTGLHKFYSAQRAQWVNTAELKEGERLRSISGWLTLIRKCPVSGTHRVYNMTVAGEHVFHVSSLGLLSHNIECGGGPPNKTAIGKLEDIEPGKLRPGESTLELPDQGSPKANWKQNSGLLRKAMDEGLPIRDASIDPLTGRLTNDTGFLRAERNLLRERGWKYDPGTQMWNPSK